jgi:hypothetical protein
MPKISIEIIKKRSYLGSFIFWIVSNLIIEFIVITGTKIIFRLTNYIDLSTQINTMDRYLSTIFPTFCIGLIFILFMGVKLLPIWLNFKRIYNGNLVLLIPITVCLYLSNGPFVLDSLSEFNVNYDRLFCLFLSASLYCSFNRHKITVK